MAKLQCELTIIRLTNLDLDNLPPGNLFVRYYVVAGGGRRIRIDTRELPSTSDLSWNEQASLECRGGSSDPAVKEVLGAGSVVFELRWRRSVPIIGRMARSKLLGRAEVAWRDVVESADMSMEKWVRFDAKSRRKEGLKPPSFGVRMEIRVRVSEEMEKRRVERKMEWNECSCGWNGSEEDMFLAATAASLVDMHGSCFSS